MEEYRDNIVKSQVGVAVGRIVRKYFDLNVQQLLNFVKGNVTE